MNLLDYRLQLLASEGCGDDHVLYCRRGPAHKAFWMHLNAIADTSRAELVENIDQATELTAADVDLLERMRPASKPGDANAIGEVTSER